MKQHKRLRFVSIVCLAALLVSCLPGAYAYGVSSAWAREELDAMAALDLIPALLEERGDLRENITRLEMCALAVQAYEHYTGEELSLPDETPFPDTNDPIAAKSYAAGFALGYEDGTFRPDRLLTRQEFFVFVSRFLQAAGLDPAEHGEDLAGFVDAGAVSAWALDATWQVVDLGVVQGSGGKLDPLGHTTCEQALAMFYRAYINLTGESQATQASVENKYPNLSPWAKEELEAMDQLGLIPEVLLGRDMATPITRGEMCYVAMEAYLSLYPNPIFRVEESPFTDADDPVITKAYYLGLISGFPDGTFRPDIPITREQFFKITVNFLSVCGYPYEDSPSTSLDHFTDAGELSSYALPCARLLVELGIVKGDGKQLLPKSSTQCQQALAMFFRSYLTLQAWMEDSVDPDGRPEADALVEFALQYVGYNYIWGGKDPSTGFDCSGFVWYVYTHNGYEDIGRTATDQWYYENSQEVSQDSLLPGDLLFFSETDSLDNITHVGIYIGVGEFVHAANSRDGVIVTAVDAPYYGEHYIGARRIIPA